ncbi:MAG: DUF547 domain-containing protein [Gammaproteobacteria bacterium]|nr:MAG: DUF547 domain-containing protein [Gammaproteobacteria bacterium]
MAGLKGWNLAGHWRSNGPAAEAGRTILNECWHRAIARCALLLYCLLLAMQALALPDYDLLDDLLINYVDNGFVDYDGLAIDGRLPRLLQQFAETREAELGSDNERKALLINAYNLFALHGVLEGQSPQSFLGRRRFFRGMRLPLLGEARSLDDIEHRELRPMGDPRIHFAIVCASLSCPRLASQAYRPERLDQQLDAAATRFVNDPARNRFDLEQGIAFLSPIFDWFAEDFGGDEASLQAFLARYVRDADVARELRNGRFQIRYEDYDWRLNGIFRRSAGR